MTQKDKEFEKRELMQALDEFLARARRLNSPTTGEFRSRNLSEAITQAEYARYRVIDLETSIGDAKP